jgi:hypothetical protein
LYVATNYLLNIVGIVQEIVIGNDPATSTTKLQYYVKMSILNLIGVEEDEIR